MTRKRITAAFAAAAIIGLTGCGANAGAANNAGDDFPKKGKSIELIVAFSSGGAVDTPPAWWGFLRRNGASVRSSTRRHRGQIGERR